MESNRREFLKSLARMGGAAVAVTALGPTAAWAGEEEAGWINVGKADQYPLNTPTPVTAATTWPDGKPYSKPRMLIVRADAGVRALSDKCTHWGCAVEWKDGALLCGCHGARFNEQGDVLKGPAKKPLVSYPARLDGDQILVKVS